MPEGPPTGGPSAFKERNAGRGSGERQLLLRELRQRRHAGGGPARAVQLLAQDVERRARAAVGGHERRVPRDELPVGAPVVEVDALDARARLGDRERALDGTRGPGLAGLAAAVARREADDAAG